MWQTFLNWLSGVGHLVMDFLSPLALSIAQNGGPILVQAATDAVTAAEAAGGTGAQKQAAALAAVSSDLTKQGIPVVINAVNAAIEAAVAGMKASQAAPAVPAPAA